MSQTIALTQSRQAADAARLSASEAEEKYTNLTRALIDRRANKVCSALGGRIEDVNGRARVLGARVLQAIRETRRYEGQPDADGRGRWKSSERTVATFAPAHLKLIDNAMAEVLKHKEMLAPAVAKRLGRSTQHLDRWARYCPYLMRGFKRRAIIGPRSNRGMEWVYNGEDEKLIRAAMQARKTNVSAPPDSSKPVTVAVAAKVAKKDSRYLREMIEDGKLSAMKEPYPSGKRGFRYKVLIQDALNLEPEPRASSYKPAPAVKMIDGKRCVLTRRACEITGFDLHQLRYRENNPNGTPGGVTLRAHRPAIGGTVRVYWEEQPCKDVAAAIERGETSPDLHLKGTAAIELPPVKIIKEERYVPTRVAVPSARCKSLEELKQIHNRTGKPRREVVEVEWGRFAYWHVGECEEEGKARATAANEVLPTSPVTTVGPELRSANGSGHPASASQLAATPTTPDGWLSPAEQSQMLGLHDRDQVRRLQITKNVREQALKLGFPLEIDNRKQKGVFVGRDQWKVVAEIWRLLRLRSSSDEDAKRRLKKVVKAKGFASYWCDSCGDIFRTDNEQAKCPKCGDKSIRQLTMKTA